MKVVCCANGLNSNKEELVKTFHEILNVPGVYRPVSRKGTNQRLVVVGVGCVVYFLKNINNTASIIPCERTCWTNDKFVKTDEQVCFDILPGDMK